jgi:hypothetical protein
MTATRQGTAAPSVTQAFLLLSLVLASACDTNSMTAPADTAPSITAAAVAARTVAAASAGSAFPLQIVVDDPLGDNTGPIDVTRMVLRFDGATGAYEIEINATPSAPFVGDFKVNVNLFNFDAPSYFRDTNHNYSLTTATSTIVFAGTSSELSTWSPGDRVYTNSLDGGPNPPGVSLFRSQVTSVPFGFLTNEDYIAFADRAEPAIVEPATPEAAVALISGTVNTLLAAGELSSDQAAGLLDKLDAIVMKISGGQTSAAINQLGAFINQVNALVHSGLDPDVGESLIGAARDVILMLT